MFAQKFWIWTSLGAGFSLGICGLFSSAEGGVPTQLKPDRVRGADLYEVNCWMCHGKKGLGDGPAAKALQTSPPALAGRIQELGLEAAADLVMQGQGDMPGYTEVLGRKDAVRILKWLDGLDPLTGEES